MFSTYIYSQTRVVLLTILNSRYSHFDVIYELEDVTTADEIISSHILAKWMDMNGDSTNDLVTTDGALSWIDLADVGFFVFRISFK